MLNMKSLKYITRTTLLVFSVVFTSLARAINIFDPSDQDLQHIEARVMSEGQLTPFPELKPLVRKIESLLNSPTVVSELSRYPSGQLARRMVLTSLFHVDLQFKVLSNDYPYDIPFKSPFPFRPTMEAILEGIELLDSLEQASGKTIIDDQIRSFRQSKIFRIGRKDAEVDITFTEIQDDRDTTNLTKLSPEKEIVQDPVQAYLKFAKRINHFGELAPFPEFQSTVDHLLAELLSEKILALARSDEFLFHSHKTAVEYLKSVKLEAPQFSPLFSRFRQAYPYRPTIGAIYNAVRFFDIVERINRIEKSDSTSVEQSWFQSGTEQNGQMIEPLYHFDRYKYHWFTLATEPNFIIFPTTATLGFNDLIRVRSVPIGFIGVETKTTRVDRHFQTPLDFWYHDVNHSRRMMGYTNQLLLRKEVSSEKDRFETFLEMDHFIQKLLKSIKPLPKPNIFEGEQDSEKAANSTSLFVDWRHDLAIKKLMRVILFEILHESALPPDRNYLLNDLSRDPNTPQPFEYQSLDDVEIDNVERRRTDNGNLTSGASFFMHLKEDKSIYVYYFHDRALSLLSNVMNKLLHGFYDSVLDPKDYVVPVKYRTPEMLVEAVVRLYEVLDHSPPDRASMLSRIISKNGNPEKYTKYMALSSSANKDKSSTCNQTLGVAPSMK